jgi:hypothetical protein
LRRDVVFFVAFFAADCRDAVFFAAFFAVSFFAAVLVVFFAGAFLLLLFAVAFFEAAFDALAGASPPACAKLACNASIKSMTLESAAGSAG